jgi:SAM-dependent methyltransferase
MAPSAQSGNISVEELGRPFDETYYQKGCGPIPYTRSEARWPAFFGAIADQLIRALQPKRVLDVGCALGFLVEAFWDRGVEAWGIDVSQYAISQVRRDMQPYCRLASVADGIEGEYDLITCIEVLEHMPEEQVWRAIGNLTRATDTILFSSDGRPVIFWLKLFREHGFVPDLRFDATFVSLHAMLLRRREVGLTDDVLQLFAQSIQQRQAVDTARSENSALKEQLAAAEAAHDQIRSELEAAIQQVSGLVDGPAGPPASPAGFVPIASFQGLEDQVKLAAAKLRSIEFRLSSVEISNNEVKKTVTEMVDSRIWRTLVKLGGIALKLTGRA